MKSVVAKDSSNNFFQIQHVVVFATKWLETLLLKLNGLKSQNISVCLKDRTNLKLHHDSCNVRIKDINISNYISTFMKSVVVTDSSNILFVGWTLAGST
jgi:hypothetical protein